MWRRLNPARRRVAVGCGALIVLLGCWCGLLARGALVVMTAIDRLQADVSSDGPIDLSAMRDHLAGLRAEVNSLRGLAGPLLAVAPALNGLPGIGHDVSAAPILIDAGVDLLDAGQMVVDAVAPTWPPRSGDGKSALAALAESLQAVSPELDEARAAIDRAASRLEAVDPTWLSPGIGERVAQVKAALPLAHSAFDLLDVSPALLGFDRPRTYLVLMQNDDELRPTGGFIGSAARVTLDRGEIVALDVRDSYDVDDYLHKPYGWAPDPLLEFMGSQLWLFRDANWSPDFPTSARKAAELYTYGLGVPVDGVIGLNQQTVRAIIGPLGPLEVEPGQTVDVSNLIDYMRSAWAPPPDATTFQAWAESRKDFIGKVVDATLARIQDQPDQIDWLGLAQAVYQSLRRRDLLIWIDDPSVSPILAERMWDGALRHTADDYWMIVDSNLGFNKANTVVESSAAYTLTLQADGSADAEMVIRYRHTGAPVEGCQHFIPYTLAISYDTLVQTCYYDYVRLLAPPGAQLTAADTRPVPAEYLVTNRSFDGSIRVESEQNKTVFGTLFVLERGRAIEARLAYHLPSLVEWTADGGRYSLIVQKQPGAKPRPTVVTLIWPEGYALSGSSVTPLHTVPGLAQFEFDGSTDADMSVTWSKP